MRFEVSRRMRRIAFLSLVAVVALASSPASAQSADELAKRLAELRNEVESLSEDLNTSKTDTRNEIQALARQKADLKVELDREQIRVQKLRAALEKKKTQVAETSTEGEDLAPIFTAAVGGLRNYIQGSLPFRVTERLAELDKIEDQRKTGVLTYPRALVRVWSLIEDELRMTHENATFQQTINLGGDELLAEVVRLGMVMLYFQTRDGRVGYADKAQEGWRFVLATEDADEKQIRSLFDSFKRQIRVGFFRIPNALPMESK